MPIYHSTHSPATPQAAPRDSAAALHDSTLRDSTLLHWKPRYPQGLPPRQASHVPAGKQLSQLPVMEVPAGRTPGSYNSSPLHDTVSMALLLLGVLLITLSYNKGYMYIANFAHNMFSTRKRENLFDDHTVSDLGILSALIFNTCVTMGLIAFYAIGYLVPGMQAALSHNVSMLVIMLVAWSLLFYLAQLALYYVLGFTFGDKLGTTIWTSGFKASQSLLGLLLLPVAIILMVYPNTIKVMLITALSLYICARIVFICKGFRIFFNNLQSSVYFILYLCAVEIVPPVLYCAGAITLCNFIQL